MIEQRVTLRYGAQQIPAIVQAVQGDTGRDVIFELADYEIPAGATANYYIDKPDGNAVYNSAEVISSTEILAHLTEQALAVPGRNNGQVRILSDGEVITSFDFVLEVEVFRGLMRMQSETEVNIFDQAIEDAVAEIQAQTPVVTGMQNSIAPTYSSSSTYAVGDYVMYNAQLYKCNRAITTAETWTAAHWSQVPLANDVSKLNSAIYNEFVTNPVEFNVQNRYVDKSGSYATNSDWQTAGFIPIEGNNVFIKGVFSNLGNRGWNVALYDENQIFIPGRGYLIGAEGANGLIIDAKDANYMRISNTKGRTVEFGFLNADIVSNTFDVLSEPLNLNFSVPGYLKTDGTINAAASDWTTTPFIEINALALIVKGVFYSLGASGYNICLYNQKHKFLRGVLMTFNSLYLDISDASYIRFSTHDPWTNITATAIIPKVQKETVDVVVDVNGTGDYTSLLQALKSTPANQTIQLKSGVYDLIDEYTDYYGQTFFDDYDGYSGISDPFYRGLWLDPGRKIVGDSGAVIRCVYSGSNNKVATLFSAIANAGNTVLENVTIEHGNLRYAIHDDYGPIDSTIVWKNIRFVGHSNGSVIGGGFGVNTTYYITGCVFEGNRQPWDINYHGSNSITVNNKCRLFISDCYGVKSVGIWPNGPATTLSTAFVSNCKFNSIQVYRPDGQDQSQAMNVELVEWNNTVG